MPQSNGHGRVGINTTNPSAPLDVADYVTFPTNEYAYYLSGLTGTPVVVSHVENYGNIAPQTSINAYANVVASEFDARSDERIKAIKGISNNEHDLKLINQIEVTDYVLKDRLKFGNTPVKKVIAQQVEKVYPQVVGKHVDFIPNVYQITSRMEKTADGYLLHFDKAHQISKAAKKIKGLLPDNNLMEVFEINKVVSDHDVLIKAADLKADRIFVYGEEVNDFRTVDYEGLTTLNISATQELSKQLKQQQQEIRLSQEEIKLLKARPATP